MRSRASGHVRPPHHERACPDRVGARPYHRYPLGFRFKNLILLHIYGRSAGHLRLTGLAIPDFPGMVKYFACFPRNFRRCGRLPYLERPGLFADDWALEIAGNLFET